MNESAGGSAAVVALIEGVPTEALRQVCDAVRQRDLRVFHVTKTPTLTAAVRDLFDEQRICDTDDSDAILDALGQGEDAVVAVGTTDGFNVLVANAVALRLGLRAQPEDVLQSCCHKGQTRELVGQADRLNPAWLAVQPQDPVPKKQDRRDDRHSRFGGGQAGRHVRRLVRQPARYGLGGRGGGRADPVAL